MNQETINAVYDKLDELRNAFETFVDENDTAEGEKAAKLFIAALNRASDLLK